MTADIHQLRALANEPESLYSYLLKSSNAQHRAACSALADVVLPEMEVTPFWTLFAHLHHADSKAYLGMLLKALNTMVSNRGWSILETGHFASICSTFSDIDVTKTIVSLLPKTVEVQQAEHLFSACGVGEGERRIALLLQVDTRVSNFMLLKALRYVEHDVVLLTRTCRYLIKRGDGPSFSLASIICTSFGLENVGGVFSLNIEPYEIARIESNFDAFCEALKI